MLNMMKIQWNFSIPFDYLICLKHSYEKESTKGRQTDENRFFYIFFSIQIILKFMPYIKIMWKIMSFFKERLSIVRIAIIVRIAKKKKFKIAHFNR